MGKAEQWLYLLAPIWYPTIGFLVCLMTLFLAAEMRDIGGDAALTFRFGARGLFQITTLAGVVVALVALFCREMRKMLFVLFGVLAVGAAILGWIFAQSVIHF